VSGPTTSHWCEHAWLGGDRVVSKVQIDVRDGRIAAVHTGVDDPPPGTRNRRGLTLPGFANVHSHAFHRAMRGRTHGDAGSFWTWRDAMYAVAAVLDPDRLHRLARAAFAEMVLAGYTAVGEFHYVHHDPNGVVYADANAMGDALVTAAADAGIRITLLDVCYLHGGIDRELEAGQRRFADGSVDAWIQRASERREAQHVRLGAAVHSVRACTPDEIGQVARWTRSRGMPLHAHVSEQPAENELCLDEYGRTPTAVLYDAGALGEQFTAVHATHLTDEDVRLLGDSGSAVCFCPSTERDLADGIGPASRLAAAGVPLTVGSDSQAVVDGLAEARSIELDQRLATGLRGTFSSPRLMTALAQDGHRRLGWPDAGCIAVGQRADLVTVALDSVRLAGADPATVLDAVVFSATAADVTDVTVDGVNLVVGRQHRNVDVASELTAAIGEVTKASR
jgi:formiminoglutamate deiminase